MRVASRGDLVALIEAEHPSVPRAEVFAALDRLARRVTGLPLPALLRRPPPARPAKAQTPRKTPLT